DATRSSLPEVESEPVVVAIVRTVEKHRVRVGGPGGRWQVCPELDRAGGIARGQGVAAVEVDNNGGLSGVAAFRDIGVKRDRVTGAARRAARPSCRPAAA